jgi:hypothetical protein
MFPFSKCIAVGLMIATVIVSNLDSKDKNPLDFE